jgi:hypothetical protein
VNNDFIRRSPDARANELIVDTSLARERGKVATSNVAWLRNQEIKSGVLLMGGVTVDHFRVRVAQSRYRDDLAPSFWSNAGILLETGKVLTVRFDSLPYASRIPVANAIQRVDVREYDEVERFPNIAILSFTDDMTPVADAATQIERSRALLDLPSMLITWLKYLWATDDGSNPLRDGVGVPGAAFVESAFAQCRVEISPGQRTSSSSPEAIWQAARWWSGYFEKASAHDERVKEPKGAYRVKQWAAAAVGVRDDYGGDVILPAKSRRPRKR